MHIATIDKGRSHLREVVVDGEVASWLTVIDYRMRLGSAWVKMGCCAQVNTRRKFRMKGYMRRLMKDTVEYMRRRGHVVSVITGISGFYGRFGYASCFPDRSLSVFLRNAETAVRQARTAIRCRTRKLRSSDADALRAVYRTATVGRTGALERDAAFFAAFPKAGQEVFVATAASGKVLGYAACDKRPDHLGVGEVAVASPDALPALLKRLVAEGVRRRVSRMEIYAGPDEPVGELCRRLGCQWRTTFHRNASTMMRTVRQDALFRAMLADLRRRIRRSDLAGTSGTLTIKTELGRTAFRMRNGRLELADPPARGTTVELTQAQLTQLATGYRSPQDVLHERGGKVSRRAAQWLTALFPPQTARLWTAGRFEELHLDPHDYPVP